LQLCYLHYMRTSACPDVNVTGTNRFNLVKICMSITFS
jgi:hypothetical protein